jgi:dipeptidyl aminopeptidase/acylaminoacyl peptidase
MKRLIMFLLMSGMGCAAGASAVTPRALLEVVDFSQPVMSPDGSQVAFRTERASVERNTYDTIWYVQQVQGKGTLPRRIADGGVVLRDVAGVSLPVVPVWSPDGRWIYYRALVDGRIDVWRAAVDGSGAVPVTHDAADVRHFRLADNGRTLQYSVGATRAEVRGAELAEYDDGIHIDYTVPLGQGLFRSGRIDGVPATQRFVHGSLARGRLLADVPDRWKAVNMITGTHREISAPGQEVPAQPKSSDDRDVPWKQARSVDGWVATLTRVGEQKDLLLKPDVVLSARGPRQESELMCRAPLCTGKQITGVQWRPGRREVLFTVTDPNKGGAQSIFRWDVQSNAVRPLVQARGLVNGGRARNSSCGVSSKELVCVTADANQPPRLERIDLDTGEGRVLFEPNAELAQEVAKAPPARLLRWKGTDGQAFTGQFYPARAAAGSAVPLFVNYYQCTGFVRGGVGDEWPFASLAEQGVAALCINQAPYVRMPVNRYNAAISAVAGAVRLLSADGGIDCAKVGMGGLSFGSEVTLWTATNSRLLAATSISTPSLSSTYYLFTSFAGKPVSDMLKKNWGIGTLQETPDRWRLLAPKFHLDSLSAPVLFQMSEQEYLFSLDYAVPLIKGDMADMYVFPNEPHQKFQPRHKLAVYERNIDWFRFWLQGAEDQVPSKRAQYVRWRGMRAHVEKLRSKTPLACKHDQGLGMS